MARLLKLDPGISAGLYAGALTLSASIGTATDAIMNLPVPIEERRLLANHVAEATGPSYVFSAIGMQDEPRRSFYLDSPEQGIARLQ
jgi:putative transport protein